MTKAEFQKHNQGWLEWGASLIKPGNWFQGFVGGSTNDLGNNELVHIPTLEVSIICDKHLKKIFQELAKKLLIFYRNNYGMMIDCPEVVDFNELRSQVSHIVDEESYELVISQLARMGEISIGHSKDGEKVLKFKVQN